VGKDIGKAPLTRHGYKDASADEFQIRTWGQQWPVANTGIAPGKSQLIVLDPDGLEGVALLKQAANGNLPKTFLTKTGRDQGYHLYYFGTGVGSTRAGKLDVIARTGYVCAPGCLHQSGRFYQAILDAPIAPVPSWVGPFVRSHGKSTGTAEPSLTSPPHSARTQNGADNLAQKALAAYQANQARPARLRDALMSIPANIDGATWYSYGAALYDLHWIIDGADRGFEIWVSWSQTSQGRGGGLRISRDSRPRKAVAGFQRQAIRWTAHHYRQHLRSGETAWLARRRQCRDQRGRFDQ
jgi:hypothetical protein